MRSLTILLSTSAFALLAASSSANLIQNGGFESPLVASNGYLQIDAPNSFTGNWVVGGSNIDLVGTNYAESGIVFNANSGNASLDLTGTGNSGANSVSQDIATTIGSRYYVSFYVGRAQSSTTGAYTGPASIDLSFVVNGLSQTYTNSNVTNGGVEWTQFSTSFVATSSSTTVSFTNATTGISNFAGLDDVSVTAAPAPGALVAFGLGCIGRLRRKRSA